MIGLIRYFMIPRIHFNNNDIEYLSYEKLCDMNKQEWKSYCLKYVDNFYKSKTLSKSLVEISEDDKEYYMNNYKNIKNNKYITVANCPSIDENNINDIFLVVKLKIKEDCKRLMSILYNIDEIRFRNLKKYLTSFRMCVLNDIFGNIIMSWLHIHHHKEYIFKKANFKFDFTNEYDLNHIIKIDEIIKDIFSNTSLFDNEYEEEEFSPETVQNEIDLLKKKFT